MTSTTNVIDRPTATDRTAGSRRTVPPASRMARAGGLAALVQAAAYVVGFGLLAAYLLPEGYDEGGPAEAVRFMADHRAVLDAWYTIIYLVAGATLVVLALALHDRLRRAGSEVVRVATAFGIIWSGLVLASGMVFIVGQEAVLELHASDPEQAASAWAAIDAVQSGLGGGIELVGGLWVGLLCWVGLRSGLLPRGLAWLGLVVGVAGVLTVAPPLAEAASVFGLGFIVWFVWTGLVLLRASRATRVAVTQPATVA